MSGEATDTYNYQVYVLQDQKEKQAKKKSAKNCEKFVSAHKSLNYSTKTINTFTCAFFQHCKFFQRSIQSIESLHKVIIRQGNNKDL